MSKRILVVDDDASVLFVIKELLEDMGHTVEGSDDPEEGQRLGASGDYDLIILDLRMPRTDGAELTAAILREQPEATILINTGYPGDPLAQKALESGAAGLIRKPFEIEKVYDYLKE